LTANKEAMMYQRDRTIIRALGERIRSQAEWRAAKSERYPDDPRNEQCAAWLSALADYVEHAPPVREPLATLIRLLAPYDADSWISKDGTSLLARFGFTCTPAEPTAADFEALLTQLVEVEIAVSAEDVDDELWWEHTSSAS
jgi:hypothetical protein